MVKLGVALLELAAVVVVIPSTAVAEPLPQAVQRLLDTAILSGKADRIDAIAAVAREAYPQSATSIDQQLTAYRGEKDQMRVAQLRDARFWEGWSGQGEFGASTSSGNDDSVGVTTGVQLAKEGLRWSHKFDGLVDYRRTEGVTEKERFNAGYQVQRKFDGNLYSFGLLQYERDRPAGYYRRFSESIGIGVRLIDRPSLRLEMDGGPAFRQTAFVTGKNEGEVSGRASMALRWDVSPTLGFTQNASAFLSDDSTFVSTSALTSKLFGALSSRLAFDVRHETNPPLGSVATNTISRLTLLYSF